MKIHKTLCWFALCAAAICCAPNFARAADEEVDRWRLITAPFVWASGLEGDATIRGIDLEIDLGFDDIFDATDFGMQTYIEVRKRKYGFFAAPSYLKLSGDAESRLLRADFDQEWWTVEGGGFFNLADSGGDTPFTLDLIAGIRYWKC